MTVLINNCTRLHQQLKFAQAVKSPDFPNTSDIVPASQGTLRKIQNLSARATALLTPDKKKPKIKQIAPATTPMWWFISQDSISNKEECPEDADEICVRLYDPKLADLPTYERATQLVRRELARLSNLLIDDKAGSDDIAHYIIFSYTLIEFDPVQYGRSSKSSLHVQKPPACRGQTLYFAIDKITHPELRNIALDTAGVLFNIKNGSRLEMGFAVASMSAQEVFNPKVVEDHRSYSNVFWV